MAQAYAQQGHSAGKPFCALDRDTSFVWSAWSRRNDHAVRIACEDLVDRYLVITQHAHFER